MKASHAKPVCERVEGDRSLSSSLSGGYPTAQCPLIHTALGWDIPAFFREKTGPHIFSGPSFPLGGLEFPFSLILLLKLPGNPLLFPAHLWQPSLFSSPATLLLGEHLLSASCMRAVC